MAQQDDFQIWLGTAGNKEVLKDLEVNGRFQGRFSQNVAVLEKYFGEIGFRYKVFDWYLPAVSYRLSDFAVLNTQRVDLDQNFRYDRFNDRFDFRLRYQYRFASVTDVTKSRLRARFGYRHKFSSQFRVYGKAEYFYSMWYRGNEWDQQRYTLGIERELGPNQFIDLAYRFEQEFNRENPLNSYIINIGYSIEF